MSAFTTKMLSPELSEFLHAMGARGENAAPVMAVVANNLVAAVDDEFETEGHGKWPPFADSTKRARGANAKLLQKTGQWVGSHEPNFNSLEASATTGVEYAVFHVSDAPRERLPLRNPYDLPDEVWEEQAALIAQYVATGRVA